MAAEWMVVLLLMEWESDAGLPVHGALYTKIRPC